MNRNIETLSINQLLTEIIILVPEYYKRKIQEEDEDHKANQQNKEQISKIMTKKSTLETILDQYQKNVSLYDILHIDEYEYRTCFFGAREDRFKNTNYIENEMKYRNKAIKEQIHQYDKQHQLYLLRRKINDREASRIMRLNTMPEKNSIVEMPIVTEPKTPEEFQQRTTPLLDVRDEIEINPIVANQKMMSRTMKQQSNNPQQIHHSQTKYSQDFKVYSNLYYERVKAKSLKRAMQESQGPRFPQNELHDMINEIKIKNQFKMTKVLFGKNNRLDLAPCTDEKLINQSSRVFGVKDKILFRKAQDNVLKKIIDNMQTENRYSTPKAKSRKKIKNYEHSYTEKIEMIEKNYHQGNRIKTDISASSDHPHYKTFMCGPYQSIKSSLKNKKSNRFTWKDKEIKFLGIKGAERSSIFDEVEEDFKFYNRTSKERRKSQVSLVSKSFYEAGQLA